MDYFAVDFGFRMNSKDAIPKRAAKQRRLSLRGAPPALRDPAKLRSAPPSPDLFATPA
jgi:hypothetical protein